MKTKKQISIIIKKWRQINRSNRSNRPVNHRRSTHIEKKKCISSFIILEWTHFRRIKKVFNLKFGNVPKLNANESNECQFSVLSV